MKRNLIKTLIVAGLVLGTATAVTLASVQAAPEVNLIAEDGSIAALADEDVTIEEMLIYALQDEYNAKAEYEAILAEFGEIRLFTNLLAAENYHIELLLPLFETYGVAVPADESAASVVVPATLEEAFAIGAEAEKNNIAMYDAFFAKRSSEDLQEVFTLLKNASIRHQNAFLRNRTACTMGAEGLYQWHNRINQMFQRNQAQGSPSGTGFQGRGCPNR